MDERRRIQRRQAETTPSVIPSQISNPSSSAPLTEIVSATGGPSVSFATSTITENGTIRTSVFIHTNGDTSTSATRSTSSTTDGAAKPTSTSTAAAPKESSNTSILIPAIVAPVAAILVISFIAFWLVMRRRTKKALEQEPEFVMEGMKEKPRDRPPTSDSGSSTQELVPTKHKDAAVNVKELDQPPMPDSATTSQSSFIPPPPRLESALDSRPGSRQADLSGKSKAVPNFSRGPRANGGSRDITPSTAPGFAQQERGGSKTGHYPPPSGPIAPRSDIGPYSQDRNDPGSRPMGRPAQPRQGSFSRPLGPQAPAGINRGPPAPISTGPSRPSQDDKSYRSQMGAYNGSSPISQYSPIVKEMPKLGTSPMTSKPNAQPRAAGGSISSVNDQGTRKPPPSAIKTGNSPLPPAEPSFINENERNVQLANNPRLGFHSMVTTTTATSPSTEEPPTPSPRLPPPATRDAPPTNYNIPLPAHEPPAPASIQARLNGASISDRRSVVSGLSDDYVDMEVDDAKSDVSSLDEREKWQMQTETERANSRQAGLGGYGGLGPRPPLLNPDGSSNSNSESGSQYSLGYYTKENSGGDRK